MKVKFICAGCDAECELFTKMDNFIIEEFAVDCPFNVTSRLWEIEEIKKGL